MRPFLFVTSWPRSRHAKLFFVDMPENVIYSESLDSLYPPPAMKTLYIIQARAIGTDVWYPFSMGGLPADHVLSSLASLASDDTTVYRAVPLEA